MNPHWSNGHGREEHPGTKSSCFATVIINSDLRTDRDTMLTAVPMETGAISCLARSSLTLGSRTYPMPLWSHHGQMTSTCRIGQVAETGSSTTPSVNIWKTACRSELGQVNLQVLAWHRSGSAQDCVYGLRSFRLDSVGLCCTFPQ